MVMHLSVSNVLNFLIIVLVGAVLGMYAIQTYKSNQNTQVQVQVFDNTTNSFTTKTITFSQALQQYPLLKMTISLLVLLFAVGAGILIFTRPSLSGAISFFVGAIITFAILPYVAGAMSSIMSINEPEFALFTMLWGLGIPIGLFVVTNEQFNV